MTQSLLQVELLFSMIQPSFGWSSLDDATITTAGVATLTDATELQVEHLLMIVLSLLQVERPTLGYDTSFQVEILSTIM